MAGIVKSGQSVTCVFVTSNPTTGAAVNADSLPTGLIYVNGTVNAASVTVTNITTGVYKAAVTLPSLSAGDVVDLRISATVSTIAGEGAVWSATADTKRVSDLADFAGGAVASVSGAVGSVTGAVGSVTGNVGGNVTGSVGSVASGGITSGSFAAGAINAAAIATDAIDADALAADAVARQVFVLAVPRPPQLPREGAGHLHVEPDGAALRQHQAQSLGFDNLTR